jgi:hypothetical protein
MASMANDPLAAGHCQCETEGDSSPRASGPVTTRLRSYGQAERQHLAFESTSIESDVRAEGFVGDLRFERCEVTGGVLDGAILEVGGAVAEIGEIKPETATEVRLPDFTSIFQYRAPKRK